MASQVTKMTFRRLETITSDKLGLICSILIFFVPLAVFVASPVRVLTDSHYSMLLSQSLLENWRFALDEYFRLPLDPNKYPDGSADHIPYIVETVNNHAYYSYPPGSSILSIPFVGIMNGLGVSSINSDNSYNIEDEETIEVYLASLLMAVLAVVFFRSARLFLPLHWSFLIALGGVLGTQVWSTASRGLPTHTWAIFLQGWVIFMLLKQEVKASGINPFILASLLSWMYFVRPTSTIPIILISIYIAIFYRNIFVQYALTGISWLIIFVAYSLSCFGTVLPSYYLQGNIIQFHSLLAGLNGSLFSPSRGLFIYVPVFFFVLCWAAFHFRFLQPRRVAILVLSVISGYVFICSVWPCWWGGHSFGARLLTDTVPWFVVLAILCSQAMLNRHAEHSSQGLSFVRRIQIIIGILFVLLSVFINAQGALVWKTWQWNSNPTNIDHDPDRLWDWKHPQFLAGCSHAPPPPFSVNTPTSSDNR